MSPKNVEYWQKLLGSKLALGTKAGIIIKANMTPNLNQRSGAHKKSNTYNKRKVKKISLIAPRGRPWQTSHSSHNIAHVPRTVSDS